MKYYAVYKPESARGIYTNWEDCEKLVKCSGKALYKKFYNRKDAERYILKDGPYLDKIVLPHRVREVENEEDIEFTPSDVETWSKDDIVQVWEDCIDQEYWMLDILFENLKINKQHISHKESEK